jgi:hypothetical protein
MLTRYVMMIGMLALVIGSCDRNEIADESAGDTGTPTEMDTTSVDTGEDETGTASELPTDGTAGSTDSPMDSDSSTGDTLTTDDSGTGMEGDTGSGGQGADSVDSASGGGDTEPGSDPDRDSGADDSDAINDTATDSVSDTGDSDSDGPVNWCVAEGLIPRTSVDVLLVVDNSNSMSEEQQMLATSLYTLVNALIYPTDGRLPIDDIRIAVTTTDLGVSYDGHPYGDAGAPFSLDSHCYGLGDNGGFVAEYLNGKDSFELLENVIVCDEGGAQCPAGWACDHLNESGWGTCVDGDDDHSVSCPSSLSEQSRLFMDNQFDEALTLGTACLAANIGTSGCNFEQPMMAAAASLTNYRQFIRRDSFTAIIVVSDEDDCSIQSDRWHDLTELGTSETNVACGRHLSLLHSIEDLKTRYETEKKRLGGDPDDLLFAVIGGVPMVDECQGTGDAIGDCLNVAPGVNGSGTMGTPEEVERLVGVNSSSTQTYFEYACERYESGDTDSYALTRAYPATRMVQMAQSFGKLGYVYSICNANWSPAMENIADLVRDNVKILCIE